MAEKFPYKSFGTKLRSLRESAKETIIDVSGAVEIDAEKLERIENGIERPSEDIVLLLINHFELQEKEADGLWKLAGYNPDLVDEYGYSFDDGAKGPFSKQPQPAIMIMPIDARIVYSDAVQITVNNHGVVMNFTQNAGHETQPLAISRIGMSKEHARSVLKVLQDALDNHEKATANKPLRPPESNK